jgi:arylsulfatase
MFGKWHLGMKEGSAEYAPHNRGFHMALNTLGDKPHQTVFDPVLLRNGVEEARTGYRTDIFFDEAIKWMEEQGDQPFFCYLPTYNAHNPVSCEPRYSEPYTAAGLSKKQAAYYGMIHNFDDNAGRLLEWLSAQPFADNTVVIYSTDNGHAISGPTGAGHDGKTGFLKEGGLYNAGMRGGKAQHWRGGTRVPFFIHWPGVLGADVQVNRVTGSIDFLPTVAEIAGASIPEGVQGKSLLPLLRDPAAQWPARSLVVHRARWEPPETAESCKYREFAVQSDHYRLCRTSAEDPIELFDHRTDPGETKNISSQNPELVQSMLAAYDKFWDKARPCMINELNAEETEKMLQEMAAKKASRKPNGKRKK